MNIKFRIPEKNDAKKIYKLVKDTNVLDLNSEYLYLLQTTHFRQYCCVAMIDDRVVGFVSGYLIPDEKKSLFIWQVAVDDELRGKGVAGKMLEEILQREGLKEIKTLKTTISPSNKSSQRLFEKLSERYENNCVKEVFFEVSDFHDAHEDEVLYTIELKK